jgi:hypothetical protein
MFVCTVCDQLGLFADGRRKVLVDGWRCVQQSFTFILSPGLENELSDVTLSRMCIDGEFINKR